MVKYLAKGYLWALLLLLYSPILIIMIFSFTEAKVLGNWTGFSTKLYSSLFAGNVQHSLVSALWNTFAIAMIAATVSTLLGSVAAIGIFNLKARARNAVSFVNNIPMLNPDIITYFLVPVVCQLRDLSRFDDGRAGAYYVLYAICGIKRHASLETNEPEYLRGGVGFGGDSVSGLAEGDLPGNPSGYDQWFYPCLHALYRRFRRDHIYDW